MLLMACTGTSEKTTLHDGEVVAAGQATPVAVEAPSASSHAADVSSDTAYDSANATQADDAVSQAEAEYAAIYGATSTQTATPAAYDPWEKWNRKVHTFNNAVDRGFAKPLAKGYTKVVPKPVRNRVRNFFNNLGQPVNATNALLQGRPKDAWDSLGRFLINTTVGIGGLYDVATHDQVPNRSEDFGQTLGVWGWKNSRYLELPLFGPRTVRDAFGILGDSPLAPVQYIELDKSRIFLQSLNLVDTRTQLFAVDSMREGATDDYALVRDAWLQRRQYQIFEDKGSKEDDANVPDYLKDDSGLIPTDVIPINKPIR